MILGYGVIVLNIIGAVAVVVGVTTVAGLGDRDATCAMVGGVVVAIVMDEAGIPARWPRSARAVTRQPVAGSSA